MPDLLDFLYLDLPRLYSFASQLYKGLPATSTRTDSTSSEFSAGVHGGLPGLLGGSGGTKAVLSADSTVTSSVHHELVGRVISSLRDQDLLHEGSELDQIHDGGFARQPARPLA